MTNRNNESEYGPHSPDYGLSYEPDPWADPEPVYDPDSWESDFREQDPNEDHAEAWWEQALREGHITREQFARRREIHVPDTPLPEAPGQGPVIRSAVEKLRVKLADPNLSAEERADDERTLATLERMLKEDE
ncbi:hypothetical protein [Streptomyces sp. LaPpAH-108]|uniref:hypothetical protein n=1 Tax=Streptomyces sp. LaPpAH-108 TaxID=1155714 RepID=UPI00037D15DC|nr:hypothetical protein [Streptomyces sp. LaPpAH-108]